MKKQEAKEVVVNATAETITATTTVTADKEESTFVPVTQEDEKRPDLAEKSEVITFYRLNKDSKSISNEDANLYLNTTRVKNVDYLKKGIAYFNLRAILDTIDHNLDTLKKARDKAKNDGDLLIAESKEIEIAEWEVLKKDVDAQKDALNILDKQRTEYENDLFCQFMSVPAGWKITCNKGMKDVMTVLAETKNESGDKELTPSLKKRLKTALQVVADNLSTIDNDNYTPYRLFVNTSLTVGVYRYYKDASKNDSKDTGKHKYRYRKERTMKDFIYNELFGKYQGTLYQPGKKSK